MIGTSTYKTMTETPFQFSVRGMFRVVTVCCLLAALAAAVMAHPEAIEFVSSLAVIAAFLLVVTLLVWTPIILLAVVVIKLIFWTFGVKRRK